MVVVVVVVVVVVSVAAFAFVAIIYWKLNLMNNLECGFLLPC